LYLGLGGASAALLDTSLNAGHVLVVVTDGVALRTGER
jgi:hypothetical protein